MPEIPTIYADFSATDALGRLCLNVRGAVDDLLNLHITLRDGVELRCEQEDVGAIGRLEYSFEEKRWVAVIDWSAIYDIPYPLKTEPAFDSPRSGRKRKPGVIEDLLLSHPAGLWKTAQAAVFDWHGGPRSGVASLAYPLCEFVFDLVAGRHHPHGLDDRLLRLRELAPGSVRTILGSPSPFGDLDHSVGSPAWRFLSESTTRTIEKMIADARETDLLVLSRDLVRFAGPWLVTGGDRDQADWFKFLGIPEPAGLDKVL